ncbi:MAG TPA: lanthionine synthetase LanC family protein [Bacteroidia bacterium]|jgi:lantibiotic modifying enzyme|nr:lanthionine synthetase LanC family protein [Bacteroidia bacterium]
MKEAVKKKLKEISECLKETDVTNFNIGLTSGLTGINLFRVNYLHKENYDEKAQIINGYVYIFLEHLRRGNSGIYYADGLPGTLWYLSYLKNKKLIDIHPGFFTDFEKKIDECILNNIKTNQFDLFYGVIGCLLFYSEANILSQKKILQKEIVKHLKKSAIVINKNQIAWQLYHPLGKKENNDKSSVNLGLSHGLPSIISCLLKFDTEFDEEIYPLVKKSINYCLSYYSSSLISSFPYDAKLFSKLDANEYNSRLAWCYGDMGIACMLWNAGQRFNIKDWKKIAVAVITKCSNRKNAQEARIVDSGICHGSAGVAHIFHRFYLYTNDLKIKKAADFWIERTLAMAQFSDGPAGYKRMHVNELNQSVYLPDNGFLEGVSGIGLVLLGWLYPETIDWDRSLLIS